MLTFLLFVIVISVLVFVHEFGHFVVAKKSGMKVEEFGFGFPPRAVGFKRGETIYSINWIPFGGFVKILGEDGDARQDPRSFGAGSFWRRAAVLLAGVFMNMVLAVVLLCLVNMIGARVGLDDQQVLKARDVKIQIAEISAGSAAQKAGLKVLDSLSGYKDGQTVRLFKETKEIQQYVGSNPSKEITLLVNGRIVGNQLSDYREVNIIPQLDESTKTGRIGVVLVKTGVVSYGILGAVIRGFQDAWLLLVQVVTGLATVIYNLLRHGRPGVELAGPVGIAIFTKEAANVGFNYLLQFVAFMSINLAVINAVPFPALDGGRFLFLIIEKIKGSPLPRRLEGFLNTASFALLIGLMILVTVKDIIKQIK